MLGMPHRYNSSGRRHYDAFFLQTLPNLTTTPGAAHPAATGAAAARRLRHGAAAAASASAGTARHMGAAAAAGAALQYSVLANQTAIHGLPAAISQVVHPHPPGPCSAALGAMLPRRCSSVFFTTSLSPRARRKSLACFQGEC